MTYYDRIKHFDEPILEMLLTEMPHTSFGIVPPEYSFLSGGIVDLGVENYPDKELQRIILRGMAGNGVRIPGSNYKIRAEWGMLAKIEEVKPGDNIPELPGYWAECLYVFDNKTQRITYSGKMVRSDQHPQESASE